MLAVCRRSNSFKKYLRYMTKYKIELILKNKLLASKYLASNKIIYSFFMGTERVLVTRHWSHQAKNQTPFLLKDSLKTETEFLTQ